jgi:hypothetical protein
MKINEDKTQVMYFSRRLRPADVHLTLNGQNISFVSQVKYLGVISDKMTAWRLHVEVFETKV